MSDVLCPRGLDETSPAFAGGVLSSFRLTAPPFAAGVLGAITFECMANPMHFRDRNTGGEQT